MTGNVRSTCLLVAAIFLFLLPVLKAQDSSVPQRWTEDKASRLVCCAAVACRRQLPAIERHQRTRNVAGGHLRSCDNRPGTRLG